MNRLRLAISILWLLSALTVTAEDIYEQIEAARKDMYRLYGTDSVSQFLETTDRLEGSDKGIGRQSIIL